jgi:hypothetical protein
MLDWNFIQHERRETRLANLREIKSFEEFKKDK